MAKKVSSSYTRKRSDIKKAVISRSVEKIRIAALGPGYRTSGSIKGPNRIKIGSPTGAKVTRGKKGDERTEARVKATNPNATKSPGLKAQNVGVGKKIRVATQTIGNGPTKPYAGRARPKVLKKKR